MPRIVGLHAAMWLVIVASVSACQGPVPEKGSGAALRDSAITVGSFDFPESAILAEIYAQTLEQNAYDVVRALELGPRELVEPALESGLVEFVPEYAGTALEFLNLGAGEATSSVDATHEALERELASRGVRVLDPAPAQDANGFAVTQATAERFDLTTLSDLGPVAADLVFGGPPECQDRPLCLVGLQETYSLAFESFMPLDASGPVTAAALEGGEVDVALLFTTSPYLAAKDFLLLADDRGLQPAENVTPVVRQEVIETLGEGVVRVVDSVSERLTTEDLTELNRLVSLEGKEPRSVAAGWLRQHGLGD